MSVGLRRKCNINSNGYKQKYNLQKEYFWNVTFIQNSFKEIAEETESVFALTSEFLASVRG